MVTLVLFAFPFPFLQGNAREEACESRAFESHLSNSRLRFSSFWWIIFVGFSRRLLRYKVKCNVRMAAINVTDIQSKWVEYAYVWFSPVWPFYSYGNNNIYSVSLRAELSWCVYGYACVHRALQNLGTQAVTVLWGFNVGRKDALRKQEWIQVWDTKLQLLSYVLCHWTNDIWDRAIKGLYIVQGCASAFIKHKTRSCPLWFFCNDNFWGALWSQVPTCTVQISRARLVDTQYHITVTGDIWAFLITLRCAWMIKVLALIKCQTMYLEKCRTLNKSQTWQQNFHVPPGKISYFL